MASVDSSSCVTSKRSRGSRRRGGDGESLARSRARPAVWKRLAAKLADLWPTLPTGRGAEFMTAGARAELQWAQRAVLADYQRIERPMLFVLGGADTVTDVETARRLADGLASHATVQWYPDLSHDLLTVPQVREALTRFIGEYRP